MKIEIKADPLMLFDLIKPFGVVFIIPFIRSTLNFLYFNRISGISVYETAAFLIILFFAEIRRKKVSLYLEKDKITIKSGVYFKYKSVIPRKYISSLYLKANPIERIFGVKTLYINTETGKAKQSDFKVKIKACDAQRVIEFFSLGKHRGEMRYRALKVAFWAAAASSTFSGFLIAAPSFYRAAKLLGLEIYGSLLDSATRLGERFFRYFPTAINTATVVLIFIYFTAFIYQFLKNLRFTSSKKDNSFMLKSGVIVKRQTVIFIKRIRALITEQTFLMRLFKRFSLSAAAGGYTGKYAGNFLIAPVLNKVMLKPKEMLAIKTVNLKYGAVSAILTVIVIVSVLAVVSGIAVYLFFDFARLIIFTFIMLFLFLLVYADVLLYCYKNCSFSVNKCISVIRTTGLKRKRIFLKPSNLGEIRLRENPFDRRRGSCKAQISVFSKSGQSINLRWINKSGLLAEILKLYE